MRPANLLLLLVVAGCAEMLRPPPPLPPAGLVEGPAGTAEPTRTALSAAAVAFDEGGRTLAGRPAAAAQAVAQLEFLAEDLPRNPRFAAMPDTIFRELALARAEVRNALGISAEAPPRLIEEALLTAAEALRNGRTVVAAAALGRPLFDPAGAGAVQRLGEIGALPQTALAIGWANQAMAQIDAEGRWSQTPESGSGAGTTVSTPRQGAGAGY